MAGHQQSQTLQTFPPPPIHTCKKKVCGLCNNVRLLQCTFNSRGGERFKVEAGQEAHPDIDIEELSQNTCRYVSF